MCFNSSKASSATTSSTVNRDERLALDGGASANVMKDISLGSSATMNVAISDMSPQVLALQQGFLADALGIVDGALSGAGNLVSDALDSILVFAKDNADRNTQFAQATQASYASAVRAEMTNDLTQVLEKGMTTIAIIVGLYFAMQVLK